jgi:hypothetical protein
MLECWSAGELPKILFFQHSSQVEEGLGAPAFQHEGIA